jgi:predicted lactoylglutathione lyase
MLAKQITPILNVSNLKESFKWFEKLGWKKAWDWGDPPDFGSVSSGKCEIFLCLDGQGGRGRYDASMESGAEHADSVAMGSWVCILVDDVDEIHKRCLEQGIEVVWPPTDTPWFLREMRVRHPDGHVLRIGHGLEEDEDDHSTHDENVNS